MSRSRFVAFIPLALLLAIMTAVSTAARQGSAAANPDRASVVRFVAFGNMGTGNEDQLFVAPRMVAFHD